MVTSVSVFPQILAHFRHFSTEVLESRKKKRQKEGKVTRKHVNKSFSSSSATNTTRPTTIPSNYLPLVVVFNVGNKSTHL